MPRSVEYDSTIFLVYISLKRKFSLQKLAVNEVGLLLWYIFTHATADVLKITALSVSICLFQPK